MNQAVLDQLVRENPGLWRGRQIPAHTRLGENAIDTGFADLNALLPTGGWPLRAVVEIQVSCWGNGELQPLLPLMARLTRSASRVAVVAPPHIPYAPALVQKGMDLENLIIVDIPAPDNSHPPAGKRGLVKGGRGSGGRHSGGRQPGNRPLPGKDIWWAAEKLLRHDDCGLVLAWPLRPDAAQVRRLLLAADASNSIGVVLYKGKTVDTPVGIRLRVQRCAAGVRVSLVKSRYGWRQQGDVVLPDMPHSITP